MDESFQPTSFSTSSSNNYKTTVCMATPDIMIDPSWYADSGATNHVTVEMNNLSLKKPYEGHEKLMIGNETKTATPLELIHSDIWGASLVNSTTRYRYYIHFLDDYTRVFNIVHNICLGDAIVARDMIRPSADLLPVASGIQSGLPQPTQSPLLDVHTSPTSQPFMSLSAHAPTPCHPMIIGAKADIFKPKVYVSVKHPLSFSLGPIEPMCVKQTLVDPNWKRAIEEEYKALRRNRTWELSRASQSGLPRIQTQVQALRTLRLGLEFESWGGHSAPRAWFDRLKDALLLWGFQDSKSDVSLFLYKTKGILLMLLDLGSLLCFLGIEAFRDETCLYLSQSKYIADLLQKTNIDAAKPLPTPAISGKVLSKPDPMDNPAIYRSIVGAL
ncbi:hypothetical protein CK203_048212 [Vitis vinifera]|uniref:Retrovirus-related Pol polyprotein from transposon RE1 n=1 Tax=Vitis vinifera TaxID=29760 RepID=A0A438H451_VITVI|nr:hypothetical protein CK203_048212 [Vitis vinifera]